MWGRWTPLQGGSVCVGEAEDLAPQERGSLMREVGTRGGGELAVQEGEKGCPACRVPSWRPLLSRSQVCVKLFIAQYFISKSN